MEGFSVEDLRAAVELSSVCFGVYQETTGRISAPNQTLRQRVGRTEFSLSIVAKSDDRIYGLLVEECIPMSLRILSGDGETHLVEVYLANAKANGNGSHNSDLIQLVDMTSDGVWEWFPSLRYEFMSERFWRILGYDHKLMPSTPDAWMSIIDREGLNEAMRMFDDHVATRGRANYNLNVTYTHKEGHQVHVKCRGAVVEWLPDGTPWRLLGTHTDITEITEAVEAKARFVSRMSHEIRTPICAILHECELLDENPGTSVIADACDQLLALCNDILTLDKICRQKVLSPTRRNTNLKDFFNKAVRRHTGEAHKKGIRLESTIGYAPSTPVMMDVSKCNQVVDNLVSNAIKYTEVGGYICVELNCRLGVLTAAVSQELNLDTGDPKNSKNLDKQVWEVVVVVKDNGQGIHPDDRDTVFDKFSQGNSAMQGAGLGLSISKELAKLMSGDVVLTSTDVGKGSTFEFRFPAPSITPPKLLTPAFGHRKNGEVRDKPVVRVLSADDMDTNRKIMRRRLRAIEEQLSVVTVEVVDAVDGRDAVEKFRSTGGFDLVFMDCLMPGMNGFDASTEIHRISDKRGIPRVPVVAVTASVSTSLHEECRAAGMLQVVTKPFDLMDLMPVFEAAMEAKRSRDASAASPRSPSTSSTSYSPSTTLSYEGLGGVSFEETPGRERQLVVSDVVRVDHNAWAAPEETRDCDQSRGSRVSPRTPVYKSAPPEEAPVSDPQPETTAPAISNGGGRLPPEETSAGDTHASVARPSTLKGRTNAPSQEACGNGRHGVVQGTTRPAANHRGDLNKSRGRASQPEAGERSRSRMSTRLPPRGNRSGEAPSTSAGYAASNGSGCAVLKAPRAGGAQAVAGAEPPRTNVCGCPARKSPGVCDGLPAVVEYPMSKSFKGIALLETE